MDPGILNGAPVREGPTRTRRPYRQPSGEGQSTGQRGWTRTNVADVAFFWLLLDAAGGPTGESERFAGREAAEAWLSERWADLRDSSVDSVALHDGDAEIYRMSLADEA
jgi:hypothetical protein